MPISPELGEQLASRVLQIYTDAEEELLRKVARRIERGIDEPGWAERKLAEIQGLRREAQATVRELSTRASNEIPAVIADAYESGVAAARDDLAGLDSTFTIATNQRTVRRLAQETADNVGATHLRILRSTDDAYRTTIARATSQVTAGAVTRREAAQRALASFANHGITGFIDSSGRAWDMASYTEMAVRSSAGRAAVGAHVDALQDNGHDLVIVSDAPQECAICRPFEGQVLSLSGRTRGYASLASAEAAGLFHPGCRHSIGIYIPGVTRPIQRTADPVGDQERQEQRYLERGVRQWKRREAVAFTPAEKAASAAKTREWQARLQDHVKATDGKRLRYRESLGAR